MKNDCLRDVDSTELIKAEIPVVEEIISAETGHECVSDGKDVVPDDTGVIRRVCKIIQEKDEEIRKQALKSILNTS